MTAWMELNALEAAVALIAFLVILGGDRLAPFLPPGVADWFPGRRWAAGSAAIAVIAVLTLSVSETTQFQTIDEYHIFDLLANPADRGGSLWNMGAFHSSMIIHVPVIRAVQAVGLDPDAARAAAKAVHWLAGALLLVAVVAAAVRLADLPAPWSGPLTAALTLTGFLLPVSNLALKTLNYDAASLFGGVLALLLASRTLLAWNPATAAAAVLAAALAAQEKLSASPVLLLVCVLVGAAWAMRRPERRLVDAGVAAAAAAAAALIVSLCTALAVGMAMLGEPALTALAPTLLLSVHEPLVIWIMAPLRFLWDIGDSLLTVQQRLFVTTLALAPTGITLVAASMAAAWLLRRTDPARRAAVATSFLPVATLAFLGLGATGLLTVTPLWAPMEPIPNGNVFVGSINGVRLHFGAHTWTGHVVSATLFAYGAFLASIPTPLLALAGATAARMALHREGNARPVTPIHVLCALALAAPAVLALLGTPTFQRYMNIPILLFVLTIVVTAFAAWGPAVARGWSARQARAAFGAGFVLCFVALIEILPFRPLYAGFRPFVIGYPDPDLPRPGRHNFSWTGWGEETLLAGKELARRCREAADRRLNGVPCEEITLRPSYFSWWRPEPEDAIASTPFGVVGPDAWPDGPGDYYVINRQAITGGLLRDFPAIQPEFDVRYRGYAMAWVFRGDRLRAADYRFQPYTPPTAGP